MAVICATYAVLSGYVLETFSSHHLTCDASVRYEQGDEAHMKGPKAAAATMNADNTYVVKIHNKHDKMRFFDTFQRLLFVTMNKMDHKLRVTLSRAGVCLHQENWDPGDNEIVVHREEARADISLDSCLSRPRSRRLRSARAVRFTWRVEEVEEVVAHE